MLGHIVQQYVSSSSRVTDIEIYKQVNANFGCFYIQVIEKSIHFTYEESLDNLHIFWGMCVGEI